MKTQEPLTPYQITHAIIRAAFDGPSRDPASRLPEPPGSLNEALRITFGRNWRSQRILAQERTLGEDLHPDNRMYSIIRDQLGLIIEQLWLQCVVKRAHIQLMPEIDELGKDLQLDDDILAWTRIVVSAWSWGILNVGTVHLFMTVRD